MFCRGVLVGIRLGLLAGTLAGVLASVLAGILAGVLAGVLSVVSAAGIETALVPLADEKKPTTMRSVGKIRIKLILINEYTLKPGCGPAMG